MISAIKTQSTIHLAPNGPEAAEKFGFSFSEPQAIAYRYTPLKVDLDQTINIILWNNMWYSMHGGARRLQAKPSMTVDRFKLLVQENFGDEFSIDRVDYFNHNDVRLEKGKGHRLVDYNIYGGYLNVRLRVDRIVRPLVWSDISPSLYPTALANLAANNADVMFAALKKTLASVLDANSGGRKRKARSGGNDEATSERQTRPRTSN